MSIKFMLLCLSYIKRSFSLAHCFKHAGRTHCGFRMRKPSVKLDLVASCVESRLQVIELLVESTRNFWIFTHFPQMQRIKLIVSLYTDLKKKKSHEKRMAIFYMS